MFDFNKFIDLLNESVPNNYDEAINNVKDYFHIGRIEIASENFSGSIKCYIDSDCNETPLTFYKHHDCLVTFYSKKDGYNYSADELKDVNMLLKLIAIYNENFALAIKTREAENLSYNTKLYNVHGYIAKLQSLKDSIDGTMYNSYYINLKGFGLVNKLYGTTLANEAIVEFAKTLKDFAEEDEVVGHLGGDNFVAFIKRERNEDFINTISRLKVYVGNKRRKIELTLISVIGYDEVKDIVINYSTILSNPSIACQYARNTKRNLVKLTPDLLEMVDSIKNIESTFDKELENGNFLVYYQPKFDIETGKIIGVEALTRWNNNGRILPPGMFVPILEKNGEIVKLDLYVLETLCKDIHNYRNMGNNIVPASCNLSRRDFELEDLEDRVIEIIKKYNVRTEDIVIEVTETTNFEENERLARFMEKMHRNGILTSVDDFGTGYSSLSVLRDFKVSEIKIDRSFINREILNDSDKIIIGSIIDMAKKLAIEVVCEGVETKHQADFLVNLGCKKAQGFLYSKPVPKLEFEAMLKEIGTYHDIS